MPIWFWCLISGLGGMLVGMVVMGVLGMSRWADEMEERGGGYRPVGEPIDLSRVTPPQQGTAAVRKYACWVCGKNLSCSFIVKGEGVFCSMECALAWESWQASQSTSA